MKARIVWILALVGTGLLLAACASFDARVERGHSLAKLSRFFVITNLNDNHALDRHIVAALKARGLEADAGPLTMMPDNNQAVVTYVDHWTWDFGDHMVFMKISVRDTRSEQAFASVTYDARVPLREPTGEIVGKLVDRLFDTKVPARPETVAPAPAAESKKRAP